MNKIYCLFLLFCSCSGVIECPEGYELVPAKQTVVTPSGVVTQPNEYGQLPPGTLRVADGVCIRKQGVLEPRPAFENFGNAITGVTGAYAAPKLWQIGARGAEVVFVEPAGESGGGAQQVTHYLVYPDGTTSEVGGLGNTPQPGKTHVSVARDRTVVVRNGAPRVLADSTIGTTGGSVLTTRAAGLPMPSYISISTATAGEVLTNNSYTSYRAVFRRRDGSYTFQGATSAAFAVRNISGVTCNPVLTVSWIKTPTTVEAGDLLEIYRVEEQTDIDLLGDRYRLAFSYKLTSSNISAGSVTITDNAIATSDDLYSNGEQEGSSLNNYMPPPSTDVVTFKGATFYNATESWHVRTLRAKGGWGVFDANGVGLKEATISTTISSAAVTLTMTGGFAAAEYVGMYVLAPPAYPTATKIIAASGSSPYTITMASAAASTFSGDAAVYDVIEVDGTILSAASARDFVADLAAHNAAGTLDTLGLPDQPLVFTVQETTVTLLNPVPATGPFTIRATHGDRYTPPLPLLTETVETSTADARTNRLFFSKIDQPEAVGPSSTLSVGKGTILKLVATQQSLFAFCTDGIYQIVGDGDDWSVEPFDPDTVLLTPDAVDTMDNTIFALTSAGLVEVTESGVKKISSPLIGDSIRALWKQFQSTTPPVPYTWGIQVACDKYRNEVWINFNDTDDDQSAFVATYIWNTETNTFTTQTAEQAIGVSYIPFLQSIVVGKAPTSSTIQLRKYSTTAYMAASLEFNPVVGEDVGTLKQWIDVTLLFESLTTGNTITPNFEGVDYSSSYAITAGTNFEHVAAVLQDYAYNKHCRFGIDFASTTHWSLLGLTYRYRNASETLRS